MIGTYVNWPYDRMQGTRGLEAVVERKLKLFTKCSQIPVGGV